MPTPPLDLDALSLDDLKRLITQLLVRVAALEDENKALRAENARLKALPARPKLAPGGMDKATEPEKRATTKAARRQKRKVRGGKRTPPVTEERTLTVAVPAGSRRKGYESYTVQDLTLTPSVIRYRRERWVTADGETIVAPLPVEIAGHFGPGVARFVVMEHMHGQVTAERLLTQLLGFGLRISKGQVIALMNQDHEAFHTEKDAVLEAGLATARWVTVDDTGARHARTNQTTTHIGDDRFAWFSTRPSKSRLNFLDLLRAGSSLYVINVAAAAFLSERQAPQRVIDALLAHDDRRFADEAAWTEHLAGFEFGVGHGRLIGEAAMVGAIVERGLLANTVIVSDDAGQFNVFTHALCWVHAERHLRRIVCATDEHHRLVDLHRHLVWWFYADLKLYKEDPTPARRTALRARFDRIFARITGFAELDAVVARIGANKDELLVVLDRPEIPLHTNGSERDIRPWVTKRKVSGETKVDAGRDTRDTFFSLLLTCRKLGLSFWDYLGARLKIPKVVEVPWLPDLIRAAATA